MRLLNDYKCINHACSHYDKPVERYIEATDVLECEVCGGGMHKVIPPTHFEIDAYDRGMKWKK